MRGETSSPLEDCHQSLKSKHLCWPMWADGMLFRSGCASLHTALVNKEVKVYFCTNVHLSIKVFQAFQSSSESCKLALCLLRIINQKAERDKGKGPYRASGHSPAGHIAPCTCSRCGTGIPAGGRTAGRFPLAVTPTYLVPHISNTER